VTRTSRIGIHIEPADFDEFKKMMPGEKRFGGSYMHWLGRSIRGVSPRRLVTVRPREFSMYCLQMAQQPSWFTLEAFAAKKAIDEDGGRADT
jgi:hypothetical protein